MFNPELPLPTGKLSRVILLWEVGRRPVEREDAAPTPGAAFTFVPTVVDVDIDGIAPTPTFPRTTFCAAMLLL